MNFILNIKRFIYCDRREDYYFAPFFRISIGLFCLLHFLSIISDFKLLYSSYGFVPAELGELFKSSNVVGFSEFASFLKSLLGFSEMTSILIFKLLFVSFSFFLASGFLTRFSAFIILFLHVILTKGSILYSYGVDNFTTIALFYCLIFPLNRQFSIDKLIFNLRSVSISKYRKLLQIHLCFVYFFSGLEKAMGINWWNGESIWKSFTMPILGNHNFDFSFLAQYPILPMILGWCIVVIELCYPFFIFRKSASKYWLALTVSMHVGIIFLLNLQFFGSLMVLLNLSAFLNLQKGEKI